MTRRTVSRACAAVGVVVFTVVSMHAAAAAPPPATSSSPTTTASACGPAWRADAVAVPSGSSTLFAVDARAADDVWAVGGKSAGTGFNTLVEHWDGARWSIVRSPSTSSGENILTAVSALAADDVWAVGRIGVPFAERVQPLVEHYDGRAWKIVAPPPLRGETFLSSVLAMASDDVWAAGFNSTLKSPRRALILHWDGAAWTVAAVPPDPGVNNYLFALGGTGRRDVWTVGTNFHGSGDPTTIHWDGRSWTRVPFSTAMMSDSLESIAAVAPADVWAGGSGGIYSNDKPVMAHWDGAMWSTVRFPQLGRGFSDEGDGPVNEVVGLGAASSTDIWAVGDFMSWTTPFESTPLSGFVGHWDGTAWRAWPREPDVIPHQVTVLPNGQAWWVGEHDGVDGFQAVIERLCPMAVSPTGFQPTDAQGVVGETFAWKARAGIGAPVTVRDALGTIDSGPLTARGSFTHGFDWAATYELLDPSGQTQNVDGTIGIAPTTKELLPALAPRFLVRWATSSPPAGLVFDVQIRRPGDATFTNWRTGTSELSAEFVEDAGPGTYAFRARLRHSDGTGATPYSPPTTIEIDR